MFFHTMGGMGGMGRGQEGPVDTRLYDLLKVKPDASEDEIKKSYRRLAKEYHPDKNPDHGDQFKEISFAYEILSNPERRRLYDLRGMDGIKEGGGGGGGFGADLFTQIFGDDDDSPFGSFFGMGGGGRRRARRKFQDTVYPLNVTLEEVYNGKTAKLRLSKKALCTKCKGSGGKTGQSYECHSCRGRGVKNVVQQIGPGMIQQMQVRCPDCRGEGTRIPESDRCSHCKGEKSEEVKKILEVHVEPGMKHNDKVTFPREGDQSDPDIEPGDVVIVIQVKPHDVFEREGDDLIAKKTISLNEALCGYEIPLKHLDGRTLILKNKPGDIITPDCIRGIIGEGMPQRRHHDLRGNLYVKFDVAFPNDHFLEDDTKYKMIETAFPPVRKVAYPSNCEEVSLMEYDEKRYRGGRGAGQAYEEDGSDEEMGGHHGPQVQSVLVSECDMELPDVVKEKLIELDDENNQLRAEVTRLRASLVNKDEILNELEEENVQLRAAKQKISSDNAKCLQLEQTIASLRVTLEEKTRDSYNLMHEVETLTASLVSAQSEIDELRRASTPPSTEESIIVEPSNSEEMMRLQEEKDDVLFELQEAKKHILELESERDDLMERAEAANAEARDMARHLKEIREQMHELETELATSRTNLNIANRGNSMFAEFAEERLKLEADMKALFAKYEAVRKQNYDLSNELDEARLLALRRSRSEGTGRCRCQELAPELRELRGRVQTLDDRLFRAKNELLDIGRTTKGIEPKLRSFYTSLKIEMGALRNERDKYRADRDKLIEEKADLAVRAANAEKSVADAQEDIETLKLQLAMMKEREQKKDAAKVSEMMNRGSNDQEQRLLSILNPNQFTPTASKRPTSQTPSVIQCILETPQCSGLPHFSLQKDLQSSFNAAADTVERPFSGLKKLRFADNSMNDEEDHSRRDSISASELRRIARKQARRGQSKVLPVPENLKKVTAKIVNPSALPSKSAIMDTARGEGLKAKMDSSLLMSTPAPETSSSAQSYAGDGLHDESILLKLSDSVHQDVFEDIRPQSVLSEVEVDTELNFSNRRSTVLDSTKEFNRTALEDVPEEKENDSSMKSSQSSVKL